MSVAVLAAWACLPRKPSVPPSRSQETGLGGLRRSGGVGFWNWGFRVLG